MDIPTWLLAVVLKPLGLLILFAGICLPARVLVQRKMRDGRLKRLLLKRVGSK